MKFNHNRPWYERMKTKIEVGKSYQNRSGVIMDVVEMIDENNYHVTNKNGVYNAGEYGNGYIVTKFGGFGNYPNPRDLVDVAS
jgi:hypothetical protein